MEFLHYTNELTRKINYSTILFCLTQTLKKISGRSRPPLGGGGNPIMFEIVELYFAQAPENLRFFLGRGDSKISKLLSSIYLFLNLQIQRKILFFAFLGRGISPSPWSISDKDRLPFFSTRTQKILSNFISIIDKCSDAIQERVQKLAYCFCLPRYGLSSFKTMQIHKKQNKI